MSNEKREPAKPVCSTNPYDFVPLPSGGVTREKPVTHERYDGLAGEIRLELTALTQIFIGADQNRESGSAQLVTAKIGGADVPVIPGSSLKGMLRSLYEIVSGGCMVLFKGEYKGKKAGGVSFNHPVHPDQIPGTGARSPRACTSPDSLCPACRIFGMVSRSRDTKSAGHMGQVAVSQGTPVGRPAFGKPVTLIPLQQPKPYHSAFYKLGDGTIGRKMYFHQTSVKDGRGNFAKTLQKTIAPGTVFTFNITFNNMTQDELDRLVYALILEEGMAHRLGIGKPAGLGSCLIRIRQFSLFPSAKDRFLNWEGGRKLLAGDALTAWLGTAYDRLAPALAARPFTELRAILEYPSPVNRSYPSQAWFKENSNVRLEPLKTLPPGKPGTALPADRPKPPQSVPTARPPEDVVLKATVTFRKNTGEWSFQAEHDGKPVSFQTKSGDWAGAEARNLIKKIDKKGSVSIVVTCLKDGNVFVPKSIAA